MNIGENALDTTPSTFRLMLFLELKEWLVSIVLAIVAVVVIQNYFYLPTMVSGESMMPNLVNGERFLANRFIYYFKEPSYGEIITFHANSERDYVKRVIAIEGQNVKVKDDKLFIDDKLVGEPYLTEYRTAAERQGHSFTEDFGPVTVPKGKIFVLGDNRTNSLDSRIIGSIDKRDIIGRADLVFWPVTNFRYP